MLANNKTISGERTEFAESHLEESSIEVGQCNIEQVVLQHVDDGWQRDLEKVQRLPQDVLHSINANIQQSSHSGESSQLRIYTVQLIRLTSRPAEWSNRDKVDEPGQQVGWVV